MYLELLNSRSHFGKFIFGFLRATLPDENGFIHNLALMTLKDEKLVLGQMVEVRLAWLW